MISQESVWQPSTPVKLEPIVLNTTDETFLSDMGNLQRNGYSFTPGKEADTLVGTPPEVEQSVPPTLLGRCVL